MTRERRTAAEAYAALRQLVTLRIAQLEQELARFDESPGDWTRVGSVAVTQERLRELIAALRGVEPGEVES